METMCTIVFHWFSCVSIRDEIHFFICLISLVVAVPVNHFSAELRKGKRLRFILPNGGMGFPSNDGCIWSMLIADENTGLFALNRLCKLSNSTWRSCNSSLLIDVPIQDRAQQIQIYKIINLLVPVGNYSMRYTMDNKYPGVTYDRTKVMDIPEDQFKLCKGANGQFCPLMTPLQPLMNPHLCVTALYTKNS